jgi:hypothetical protein
MKALFIYLLKSSGLIATFYLSYYLFLRKETFFTSNRWFLLLGLFTSTLLPLVTLKKTIWVEAAPKNYDFAEIPLQTAAGTGTASFEINWYLILIGIYVIGLLLFLFKFLFDFRQLTIVLKGKTIQQQADFKCIDVSENVSPFSYFNYIVYNSALYSPSELENILEHEKVHCKQNHSIDVIIANLFCMLFWYNPFIWLYKKSILQNLEFIADYEATKNITDKKAYQITLLKVTTHDHCVAISNHFYQSLIKKRIIMLNKNQSKRRNFWKYALIIPALIGFIILFQIKTIAQEKEPTTSWNKKVNQENEIQFVINKNSSEEELKNESKKLKEQHGITLKCSKVKRNPQGEITGIKVEFKDKNGNKGVSHVEGDKPIQSIYFYKNNETIGFGKPKTVRIYANVSGNGSKNDDASDSNDSITSEDNFNFDFDIEVPEPAEMPELAEVPEIPEVPYINSKKSKIIIKKGGKKPVVIINGKMVEGDDSILNEKEIAELKEAFVMNEDGEDTQIIINGKDMSKIRNEALQRAQIEIKRINPQVKAQIEKNKEMVRREMERVKPQIEKAKREMELSKPEMEKAKAEMLQAKAEMIKAKAEMEAARTELEKAKAELQRKSKN